MKGVSNWFWIAAGVVAGLVVFSVAYTQIAQLNQAKNEQRALEQFDEVKNIINNLCWTFAGNKREYEVSLTKSIEGFYVAETKYTEYTREEMINKIIETEEVTGNFLCLKVEGKRLRCEELYCNTTMPFLGSVPEGYSLSALVNEMLGRGEIFDYFLKFEKSGTNIEVNLEDSPGGGIVTTIPTATTTTSPITTTSSSTTTSSTTTTISNTFTILYIQLNGNIPNLETGGENAKNLWVSLSPLSSCSDNINAISVTDKICNVPDQSGICGSSGNTVATQTMNAISNCVNDWDYNGDYTRVVGVLPGTAVCIIGGGGVRGYTYLYSDFVVSVESSLSSTSTHELGHTFGLCDEGYGNCISSACSSGISSGRCDATSCVEEVPRYCCPNSPEINSIMCSSDPCNRGCSYNRQFASTSYSHLENELNSYC